MKIKYILTLFAVGLALLSATIIMTKKRGVQKFEFALGDGESLAIDSVINSTKKENLIIAKTLPALNSAIIRSFETDSNNVMDFVTYANYISLNRNLGYWSVLPNIGYNREDWSYQPISSDLKQIQQGGFIQNRISDYIYAFDLDWKKSNGFSDYYHNIFQNKTARTLLFEQALEILCSLCTSYPSDFKKSILTELNQLLNFTKSLTTNKNVDPDKINDYYQGFIYRRYKTDKVPITEIQNTIIKAQSKIKAIDVSKQHDAMFEININNQVTFFYSSKKFIIYSKSSAKEISFSYETSVQNVKYLKDNVGEYYQLTGSKNAIPFTYLYDKNLVKIE